MVEEIRVPRKNKLQTLSQYPSSTPEIGHHFGMSFHVSLDVDDVI